MVVIDLNVSFGLFVHCDIALHDANGPEILFPEILFQQNEIVHVYLTLQN